jgi:hypothetical protein
MSSVASSSEKRQTAYTQARAAKQRRQYILIGVMCLGLIGVFVWEAPTFMKLFRGSKSETPVVAPPPIPVAPPASKNQLKQIRKSAVKDPFTQAAGGNVDTGVRNVPSPPGVRDPFAAPASVSGAAPTVVTSTAPLPEQIVIGTPGAGRHATHGWIVILASIPTGRGKQAATGFAASATQAGIDPVAVLNSSNRKPLRGGYWVVYTGPFKTLAQVTSAANGVHSHGYAGAYIRELIVYS